MAKTKAKPKLKQKMHWRVKKLLKKRRANR